MKRLAISLLFVAGFLLLASFSSLSSARTPEPSAMAVPEASHASELLQDPDMIQGFPVAAAHSQRSAWLKGLAASEQRLLLVWSEQVTGDGEDTGWDIFGYIYDVQGDVTKGAMLAELPADQKAPAAAYNSVSGEFLVVWEDQAREGEVGIGGRRLREDGEFAAPALSIVEGPGVRANLQVAHDPLWNRYLLTWWEMGTDGRWSLFGGFLSGDGALLEARQLADLGPRELGQFPEETYDVAYNGLRDEFLIVYEDRTSDEGDIQALRISPESWVVGQFTVASGPGVQGHPSVTQREGHGEYLIAWQDGTTTKWGVFSAEGTLQGEVRVDPYGRQQPSVAFMPLGAEGKFLLAQFFVYDGIDDPGYCAPYEITEGISLDLLDSHGNITGLGTCFPWFDTSEPVGAFSALRAGESWVLLEISWLRRIFSLKAFWLDLSLFYGAYTTPQLNDNHQEAPAASYNSVRDEVLAVWLDVNPFGLAPGMRTLRAQRLRALPGDPPLPPYCEMLGEPLTVHAGHFTSAPALGYNPERDSYLVAYAENEDVFTLNLSAEGVPLGTPVAVSTALRAQEVHRLLFNPVTGEYILLWTDFRSGTDWNVMGALLTAQGQPVREIVVAAATGDQSYPDATVNTVNGDYLVVWEDSRSGDVQPGVARLDRNGHIMDQFLLPLLEGADSGDKVAVAWDPIAHVYRVVYRLHREGSGLGQVALAEGEIGADGQLDRISVGRWQDVLMSWGIHDLRTACTEDGNCIRVEWWWGEKGTGALYAYPYGPAVDEEAWVNLYTNWMQPVPVHGDIVFSGYNEKFFVVSDEHTGGYGSAPDGDFDVYGWFTRRNQHRAIGSYRAPSPPVLDGNLGEWQHLPPVILDRYTADYVAERVVPEPDDLSAEIWSMWTADTLYLAFRVRDEAVLNDSAQVWHDDEIEIGLDSLHDHASGGADDHQFTVNPDGRRSDFGSPTTVFQAAVRVTSGGYNVEVAIPASLLGGGPLTERRRIGITFGLHDDDDGGVWDSHLIWEGARTNESSAEYGNLYLAGSFSGPTPVPSATPTHTPSATATLTATPTPTSTATATHPPTLTPTATRTPTITPTASTTPTPTGTATPSATPSPTVTPTSTPTSRTGAVAGIVYADLNLNGLPDFGEGLEGVLITVRQVDGTGTTRVTTTGPNGRYEVQELLPGQHRVEETDLRWYRSLSANSVTVEVLAGATAEVNFADYPLPRLSLPLVLME